MSNKADGVWGYSSPNKPHIIFSVDEPFQLLAKQLIDAALSLLGNTERVIVGQGCWQGKAEIALALDSKAFFQLWDGGFLAQFMKGQTHVLQLGVLEARNWRKAVLVNIADPGSQPKDIGVWKSCTSAQAMRSDVWSYFNGSYFMCFKNPATSPQQELDRETAQLVLDLRKELILCRAKLAYGAREAIPLQHSAAAEKSRYWLIGKTLLDGTVLHSTRDVYEASRPDPIAEHGNDLAILAAMRGPVATAV